MTFRLQALLLFILLMAGMRHPAAGQMMAPSEEVRNDTVITAFVPAAAYASDIGFIGAIAINRFRYHPSVTPYLSLTEIRFQASTKAYLDLEVAYERTETLGKILRSRWIFNAQRNPYDSFFGIGNQTHFSTSMWEDRFYFYDVMRVGFKWIGRKNIYTGGRHMGRLGLSGSAGISYELPHEDPETLMGQDRPRGIDGGWYNTIGLGMIWENRDSEFAARRGNRFEIKSTWAPRFLLSDFQAGKVTTDYSHFISLPLPVFQPVLAARVSGAWAFGSVPYWDLPYLGDDMTLRGYPQYRFRGNAALFYNLELRTWLYHSPFFEFKFGIHGFHDGGRVFSPEDAFRDVIRNYHRTFGGGVAIALFTPDFILRIDAGFSDEMYRLYMNIGYMF